MQSSQSGRIEASHPYPESCPSSVLLTELSRLHAQLAATDLRPSPTTDAAFGRLVELCVRAGERDAREVLADPRSAELVPALRAVSARGETLLEHHWAERVLAADDAWTALRQFPYLDNYRELVRMELAAAEAVGFGMPKSVVILGAGPLPLTGLVLAHEHGIRVVHVDHNTRACASGAELAATLGLSDRVSTVVADASEAAGLAELREADLVVLAALVGMDGAAKRPVLAALSRNMRADARLLVRSAHRLRTVLYPAVAADDLLGFRPLLEMHPWGEVVNSVLLARPEPVAVPQAARPSGFS
ncbi:nicotianamine synthase [Tamaricihabitans halophyticus]|uniref:Nicotianamine synthase n=1 Tax=Tamaricihabitans halophyticus TaxID=1262583 RepID=A0A4R2R0Q1_9PSEU|nr:nicotianamine synthase family protein [Tamaricihabitans halophyticus]TCP55028.1 nicotianamine synthase [Tamaricihabitans halophyticus]